MATLLTRRTWLTQHTLAATALVTASRPSPSWLGRLAAGGTPTRPGARPSLPTTGFSPTAPTMAQLAPGLMQSLALQAVDVARTAGAQYADARVTRNVFHLYGMAGVGLFVNDEEMTGIGVRVLVNGYWGFAASPYWAADEVDRLAKAAVAMAKAGAKGPTRAVELGDVPVVTGSWTTPIRIEPFTAVPIEEKLSHIVYWKSLAKKNLLKFFANDGENCFLRFNRHEKVLATSAGTLVTQTLYETGGDLSLAWQGSNDGWPLKGFEMSGKGWELFLDANIPKQLDDALTWRAPARGIPRALTVGRYTVVCDGLTMASLVGETLGVGTQLDRALGYEANARGTSFLDDPLAMVGTFPVASPLVTVTANRSAPTQLATVKWDDEGVVPSPITLVKDGVLEDFQTTRESAGWLAPASQRQGKPVRSNGCAGGEDALSITLQHMPNLELAPNPAAVELDDLVKDVKKGILLTNGAADDMDFQARNGIMTGRMDRIENGRVTHIILDGAVQFNTLDLWKHLSALGGRSTQTVLGVSRFTGYADLKGQPFQRTSYSVRAGAATLPNQAVILLGRRA